MYPTVYGLRSTVYDSTHTSTNYMVKTMCHLSFIIIVIIIVKAPLQSEFVQDFSFYAFVKFALKY